jgi:hypothetical protein
LLRATTTWVNAPYPPARTFLTAIFSRPVPERHLFTLKTSHFRDQQERDCAGLSKHLFCTCSPIRSVRTSRVVVNGWPLRVLEKNPAQWTGNHWPGSG